MNNKRNKRTPTKAELEHVADIIKNRLGEIYDDFYVVGFIAGTDEPLSVVNSVTKKGTLALREVLTYADVPTPGEDDEAGKGS